MKIVVLGCGISGLSTAIKIYELFGQKNHDLVVEVWANTIFEAPHDLVENPVGILATESAQLPSTGAGALWECPPYLAEHPDAVTWAMQTRTDLCKLVSENCGVAQVSLVELTSKVEGFPKISSSVAKLRDQFIHTDVIATQDPLLTEGHYTDGRVYSSFVITMPLFLKHLKEKLVMMGAVFRKCPTYQTLGEVLYDVSCCRHSASDPVILVNCTGIGAGALVKDSAVYPTRGQLVHVYAPWITRSYLDDDSGAYVIPRANGVLVCGGTADRGKWDTVVDQNVATGIMQACTAMLPSLERAEILGGWTGLRPSRRGGVRLELERMILGSRSGNDERKLHMPGALSRCLTSQSRSRCGSGDVSGKCASQSSIGDDPVECFVVHNYGHGGSGVVLSGGAAGAAAQLLTPVLQHFKTVAAKL